MLTIGNQFGFEQLVPFLERVGIGQGANLVPLSSRQLPLTKLPLTTSYNLFQLPLTKVFPYMYVYFDGIAKGPGKRGHIVADTLLPTQMFPRLPARATIVADTNFVSGT